MEITLKRISTIHIGEQLLILCNPVHKDRYRSIGPLLLQGIEATDC